MKDEIKEILDSTRKIIKSNRENGFDRIIMLGDDIDQLLDYITNLQKTNKNLKGCIEDTNINYKNIITNLEEELKSANESISWWQNRFNAVEKENKRLKEEIEITQEKWDKDKQWVECRTKEWLDYKTRNEKAIEYCEYNDEGLYTFEPDYDYEENIVDNYEPTNFREELLNILQGGDK